jgi:nucleotide-binding universal stress UspA family protein
MADADANSIAAELVARLGGYDQELAIAAMEDALQYASRQSGVQVEITSHGHRLIMKCDSEERIGCSIFDQAGLRDVNRVRDEIEYWAKSQATGFSHHFAFLFADPTECEEEIRRLKQETLMLNAARELYALNHILEPEHTYFLLQCAGLEGGSAASEPGQGSGGKGGGAASGGLSGAYQPPESHFDVFISYNTEDQEEVREIVNRLREAGINPWFDVDELLAGDTWGRELEKAIEHIGSAAVFLGKGGLGPWHQEEMYAILNRFTSLGRRIIPVILSGGLDLVDLPLFLQNRQWVDFRVSSPDPLQRLINGITGKRPR